MMDAQDTRDLGWLDSSFCCHGPVDYRMLTDLHEVASISSEWDELLAIAKCNRAFNCSKWYLATVELLPTLQPLVFTAYRNQMLAGVFPLWLDVNHHRARFGDSYREYLDIIAGDGDIEVIRGLLNLALQGNDDYDHVVLESVRYDSNIVQAAKAVGLGEVVDGFFAPGKSLVYAFVDLGRGYHEYVKSLQSSFRHNLHRFWSKAARDGLVVAELSPVQLRPDSLPDIFLSLQMARFGNHSDFKSAQSWIRKLFPALFAERRMRVFAVLDQERIVGIDMEMVTASGMYSYNGGFLPEMRRYGPGKLMIHKAIQQACLEGLTEFDLGWWGQGYKADWNPARREVGELRLATNSGLRQSRQDPD